jgi:hypothetical protein
MIQLNQKTPKQQLKYYRVNRSIPCKVNADVASHLSDSGVTSDFFGHFLIKKKERKGVHVDVSRFANSGHKNTHKNTLYWVGNMSRYIPIQIQYMKDAIT